MPSTILGALRSAWGRGEEARSGALFGSDEWRTRTQEITLGRTLALRRAHGRPRCFEGTVWPVPLDAAPSDGLRVVAVTPLCVARGWLPDGLEDKDGTYRGRLPGLDHEVVLRTAFVPRPIHVSGWDMAAGVPKSTSRMVAPGAVYFFERTDGQPFDEANVRSLWLAALGGRTEEGFGRVVAGVWRP